MTLLLTLDDGSLHRKLADADDVARAAVLADAPPDQVGDHVGVEREDAVSLSHLFEASVPGYRGWRWSVTVAVAGPDEPVTVSELSLRPGPEALVAPTWVPWDQRVRAGDLGVGDLFPTDKDDPRIVPAYLQSDDPAVEEAALEAGLGRVHVLSRHGRLDAAARWHGGEFGPRSDMARSAPATCGTCGFFVPLAGSLRAGFGACANDIAPADGHVVDVQYGCGAHSEVQVEVTSSVPVAELVYDDSLIEFSPDTAPAPENGRASEAGAEEPKPGGTAEEPTEQASETTAEPGSGTSAEKPAEAEAAAQPEAGEVPAAGEAGAGASASSAEAEPKVGEAPGIGVSAPLEVEAEPGAPVSSEAGVVADTGVSAQPETVDAPEAETKASAGVDGEAGDTASAEVRREDPAGEAPAGENPAGENPAGENPAGENPAGEGAAGGDALR
ncbi:DUF3027 domain-containing protein [Amycolatopsis jiangsuensis]|uniref:DUF3027 family protein n=1 Tax=Amycolatopsis jiangsuensis TaxID=1181879 RepID=A0A840J3M7_9PSEU|nr:DUF3027 domain-containing protein [Amycolatopsis jiangsuensis]MBB4688008.1 hypothetical protein [Amycolatopsis jiangsuensis]